MCGNVGRLIERRRRRNIMKKVHQISEEWKKRSYDFPEIKDSFGLVTKDLSKKVKGMKHLWCALLTLSLSQQVPYFPSLDQA